MVAVEVSGPQAGGLVAWSSRVLGVEWTAGQLEVVRGLEGGPLEGAWGGGQAGPEQRAVVALRLGRRGGKTTIAACYALWRAMTCGLDEAGGGAQVVCPIVAPGD